MLGLFLRTVEISAEAGCVPEYDSLHDVAAYLKAAEDVVIPAGERVSIRTGVRVTMPDEEIAALLTQNMVMALDGLVMLDAGRLIDRWDSSEIRTLIWNTTDEDIIIHKGRRVCRISLTANGHASYVTIPEEEILAKTENTGASISWGEGEGGIDEHEPEL